MNPFIIAIIQATSYLVIAAIAITIVKISFKKHAMLGTQMIASRPKVSELSLSSGAPSLIAGTVLILIVSVWLLVPLVIAVVIGWNIWRERARYDLRGRL